MLIMTKNMTKITSIALNNGLIYYEYVSERLKFVDFEIDKNATKHFFFQLRVIIMFHRI